MPAYTDNLANARATIRLQSWAILVALVIVLLAVADRFMRQTDFTVHIPPDLSHGATVRAGHTPAVPPPNVYAFGYLIWQQVNRWAKDGSKDYVAQIYALQNYLTPSCREQLLKDVSTKAGDAELIQRTRALLEIPGYGYTANRVTAHGNGGWTVLLDAQILETSRGMPVKDTFIRYPLHVVRYDVDRERNPWGLALNCFAGRYPERIDPRALEAPIATQPAPAAPLPPAAAPSTADPDSDLPQAVPLRVPETQEKSS
ncbi:PFL_4703 family integrating conjugative element protein [Aromatoleum evansii]|uniref:PFL_4703 family integrating conjugative element protein n=1 Tax=Aromatoleum evansii TaxID=59406 RepID=UPI00145E4C88|nr:TIGR03746 family integrating conjugative element protein [Aromatoleum evansii]NMG30174.1 TIGR03746 family integrating conjugative element protein [Aromatoleum evansii]